MTKAGHRISGLLLFVAGAGIGWAVHELLSPRTDEAQAEDEEAAPEIAPADMQVRVTTAEVTSGELPIVVLAAGSAQADPAGERTLTSRAGGRVLETHAARGQLVEQGELLLRIDPAPLQTALLQASAALAQSSNQLAEFDAAGRHRQLVELQLAASRAHSQAALLEAQATRLVQLHDEGLVSDKAFSEARLAAEQAAADRDSSARAVADFEKTGADLQRATLVAQKAAAEGALQEAERMLAETEVRAPSAGQILEFSVWSGARIEPGAMIAQLLAPEGRVIVFGVAAGAARELHTGARASWDDERGERRGGTLVRLGGAIDASSGLIQAVVAPDANVPPPPPGLGVRGEIELRRLTGALLVPERAVLRAHDEQVVVVVREGHARVVPVEVAGRHAGLAAVEGQLRPGERVIVEGGYNLPDGARVVEVGAPEEGAQPHGPDEDGK